MKLPEEKVKEYPLKKYPCKKNKGEHEWEIYYRDVPTITYCYKGERSIMYSQNLYKDKKIEGARLLMIITCRCIHCGKKYVSVLSDKINIK